MTLSLDPALGAGEGSEGAFDEAGGADETGDWDAKVAGFASAGAGLEGEARGGSEGVAGLSSKKPCTAAAIGDSEGWVAGASSDPRGSVALPGMGAAMPISVRLRASCGLGAALWLGGVLCVGTVLGVGTAMPISVRPRLRSGMAGAGGRLEPGGDDGEGPGSERRVSGVRLTFGFGALGGAAASGVDPHSESMSSVGGASAELGGTEGAFPRS
jgi:hypothetical protein